MLGVQRETLRRHPAIVHGTHVARSPVQGEGWYFSLQYLNGAGKKFHCIRTAGCLL